MLRRMLAAHVVAVAVLVATADPTPPPPATTTTGTLKLPPGAKVPASKPPIVVGPIAEADVSTGPGRPAAQFAKELEAVRPALSACANEDGKERTFTLSMLLHDDGSIASIDAIKDAKKLTSCLRGTLLGTHFSTSTAKDQTMQVKLKAAAGENVPLGKLDKDALRQFVKDHFTDVKGCYDKAPKEVGDGAVTMRFIVDTDGTMFDSEAIEATKGFTPVTDCMKTKTLTWKLPKPSGKGRAVVTFPFAFKKTPAPPPPVP